VNSAKPLLATLDQSPALRYSLAATLALVMSLIGLLAAGRWLNATPRPLPVEQPLDMRVVEIEPPAPREPETIAKAQPVKPAATRQNTHAPTSTPTPRPSEHAVKAVPKAAEPSPLKPEAPAPTESEPAPVTHAPEQSNAVPAADSGARAIAQPLPNLPDDLREEAYQATALARFTIHPDGTADVDLVKPTPNPRLNQLLLEALHHWRFFPAMQSGHPVESHQDIRVHFNVN
jgi:periplasmic protein TonB